MENSAYLSEKRLREIEAKIERLIRMAPKKIRDPDFIFLDNSDFMRLLNISKKTSTLWRNQGKIAYARINNKIFFKLSDIQKMIESHRVTKTNNNKNH